MTKADIINNIAIATGYDKTTVGIVVESFTKTVKNSLAEGNNVFIRGFGSFITKKRAAKIARNITNRSTVKVPEHKIPFFKPAADFKEIVRNVKTTKK